MTKEELVKIREYLDYCEANQDALELLTMDMWNHCQDTSEMKCATRGMCVATAIDVPMKKFSLGGSLFVRVTHPSFSIYATIDQCKCCERVVTTREIPETIIPARKMEVIPAKTVEEVSWKCPESIFALAKEK